MLIGGSTKWYNMATVQNADHRESARYADWREYKMVQYGTVVQNVDHKESARYADYKMVQYHSGADHRENARYADWSI